MNWLDHALAFAMGIALPAYAALMFPRFLREVQAGRAGVRLREFREIILIQWLLVAWLAGIWIAHERAWSSLGLAWPTGWRLALTAAVAIGSVLFFAAQVKGVASRPEVREQVSQQLAAIPNVAALIPRTREELNWFLGVAFTAGICEEILYRGFLVWYLEGFVGRWPAVALALLVFGLGHAYQGASGGLRAGLAGCLAMAAYLGTGSLVAPMVLHAAMDVGGGAATHLALRELEPAILTDSSPTGP